MRTEIFSAKFESLDAIREFAAQAARDAGMDDASIYAVELSTDEACSNIIEHAYASTAAGDIECTCASDDQILTIVLRDHGCPFDIMSIPQPDMETILEERRVGGLGVYLMRKLMDEVVYENNNESGNVLTLTRKLKSEP